MDKYLDVEERVTKLEQKCDELRLGRRRPRQAEAEEEEEKQPAPKKARKTRAKRPLPPKWVGFTDSAGTIIQNGNQASFDFVIGMGRKLVGHVVKIHLGTRLICQCAYFDR